MIHRLFLRALCTLFALTSAALAGGYEAALVRAGENRAELEAAVEAVPEGEREAMRWLIERMPQSDLTTLGADFLLRHHGGAFEAWRAAPWKEAISEELFLDAVLPYASVNERRDEWRQDLRERCLPMVEDARTPGEAAAMLNNSIWKAFNVKYSTKRKKADQSPYETMESGLASCTGLSVLLIDCCRAVGVPARFVGTPRWSDDSGNHSWVEVWSDGDWHFTGAFEPTGMKLDEGWFAERAAGAKRDEPMYAVYATTWRETGTHFPLVWLPEDTSVSAVNVTDRYTGGHEPLEEGACRVRLRVMDPGAGERCAARVQVFSVNGDRLLDTTSKDERFDTNDHIELDLVAGTLYLAVASDEHGALGHRLVAEDEGLWTLATHVVGCTTPGPPQPWDGELDASAASREATWAWLEDSEDSRASLRAELDARVLKDGDLEMPFAYSVHGDAPEGGRSLYISMHGGGGAPKEVNDQQWENQKRLYQIDEGVYLAPRAPTDTWNLWHQGHIDGLFDRLIELMVLFEGVNPDRVYLTGYSAGGDGVYQLSSRMADRFAAAAMMAGHPNETKPDGLRNLPFALHMGGDDAAYDRNRIAREWKQKLADLHTADPGGYENQVVVHEGKGHWMDREDAVALPWMAEHTRDLRPTRIVWLQDDVTHERFYWLRNPAPKERERIVVSRDAQTITIEEAPAGTSLELRLDDSMLDLDQEVVVRHGESELFRGVVPRTLATIRKTADERHDPRGIFTAEVSVTLP